MLWTVNVAIKHCEFAVLGAKTRFLEVLPVFSLFGLLFCYMCVWWIVISVD